MILISVPWANQNISECFFSLYSVSASLNDSLKA